MEYLFKKDELQKLLNGMTGDVISIKINFMPDAEKNTFKAEVSAADAGADADGGDRAKIFGCPNPPGCP